MSHEEIARRLRDEGMATAPPDLAEQVMAAVRAEPRRRRRLAAPGWLRAPKLWPLAGWATAAACLVAAGFGIAHLGGGGVQSSANGSESAPALRAQAGEASEHGGSVVAPGVPAETLEFSDRRQAQSVLGPVLWKAAVSINGETYSVSLSRSDFVRLRHRALADRIPNADNAAPLGRIRVILRVRQNR